MALSQIAGGEPTAGQVLCLDARGKSKARAPPEAGL
jgi:hypothetical protein